MKKKLQPRKTKLTITFTHDAGEYMPSAIEVDSKCSIAEMYLAMEAIHSHIHDAASKLETDTNPMNFLVNAFEVAAQSEEE